MVKKWQRCTLIFFQNYSEKFNIKNVCFRHHLCLLLFILFYLIRKQAAEKWIFSGWDNVVTLKVLAQRWVGLIYYYYIKCENKFALLHLKEQTILKRFSIEISFLTFYFKKTKKIKSKVPPLCFFVCFITWPYHKYQSKIVVVLGY